MKKYTSAILPVVMLAAAMIVGGVTACNTTQQRTTYNTLASLEATGTATVDGYFTAAANGLADTNGIPKVAKAFNQFQSVMQVSVMLAQNNTNALAPANVVQELSALVAVVGEFSPKAPTPKPTPTR